MLRAVLISIGLVVLVFAVFGQTRGFDFVNYDDDGYVTAQPELKHGYSADGFRWATRLIYGGYMPLTGLSFLTDAQLYGMRAGGYHMTSVALHALAAVLLFLFLYRTTREVWPSALVAALFAIHPLRAESVAWISSRKDVLCGVFWMLTLNAYAAYARKPNVLRYVLVFLGVCAALLSKPMAVTLPFVLLLVDVWPLRRLRKQGSAEAPSQPPTKVWRLALEKLPLLIPAVAISAATMSIQQESGAVSTTAQLPVSWRIANAVVSYAAYLWKTIWPVDLIVLYPFPENGVPRADVIVAIVVLAAITIAVTCVARRAPWALTGWLWYLGTLVPVIGLVQVGAQSMADRYTYLPQIGVLVIVVWSLYALCKRWPRSAPVVAIASVLVVAASMILAYRQTQHWKDGVALWSHAAAITPNNFLARSSLGQAYLQINDLNAARSELEAAIQLQPTHRATRLNMAIVAIRQGRLDDAFLYCRAMTIEWPEDPDANTAWGSALIRYGLYERALERLDLALRTNPNHPEALSNRGAALLALGRSEEARVALEHAIQFAPGDPVILTNLAVAYYALGNVNQARHFCAEALRSDPAYELALALQKQLEKRVP